MLSPALDDTVTTQVTDNPAVFVFGVRHPLTEMLASVVSESGLEAKVYPPDQWSKTSLTPELVYKVFWVVTSPTEITQSLPILKQLLALGLETVVFIDQPTLISSSSTGLKYWSELSRVYLDHIQKLGQLCPQLKVRVIQDCLWPKLTDSPLRWLVETLAGRTQPKLDFEWSPLLPEKLKGQLLKSVFDPRSAAQLLITGGTLPIEPTIANLVDLSQKVFQRHWSPMVMTAQSTTLSEQFVSKTQAKATENELHKMVAEYAQQLPLSPSQSPPPPKVAVATPAPPSPPQPQRPTQLSIPTIKPPVIQVSPKRITPAAPVVSPVTPKAKPAAVVKPTPPRPLLKTWESASTPVEIDHTIWQLFAKQHQAEKTVTTRKEAQKTIKLGHKLKRRKRIAWSGLVILLVLAVTVSAISSYFGSLWILKQALLGLAGNTGIVSQTALKVAPPVSQLFLAQVQVYSAVVDQSWLAEGYTLAELFHQVKTTNSTFQEWSLAQKKLAQALLGGGQGFSRDNQSLQTQSQELYQQLTNIQADLKQLQNNNLSESETEALEAYGSRLKEQRTHLSNFNQMYPLLPTLAGLESKRTYAVVLQNNQELRPTGGFIQAVALITLDKGQWVDQQVFSSYELDNKQLAVVKPPQEITDLLGEKRWYLRDANWSPDFPTSANQIAWFIESTTNKQVDGVIAVDLTTLQKVIKASGPLDLPAFNEVLTDNNLWERFEFHSELQLPGPNQPPDYASYVMTQLLKQLSALDGDKALAVAATLSKMTLSQNLQMSLTNATENQTLHSIGWSGALLTPPCPAQFAQETCVVDTMAQVEANIGVNKANYYIKRTIDHQVDLSVDKATHTRHIKWQNTATSNAWPKGSYKAYTRFYLPETAQLQEVSVNGSPLPLDQVPQKFELGRKVLGVVTDTTVQQTTELELVYTTPLPGQASFAYTFFDQRQPGLLGTQRSITFGTEGSLRPKLIAPSARFEHDQVHFELPEDKHAFVGVQF